MLLPWPMVQTYTVTDSMTVLVGTPGAVAVPLMVLLSHLTQCFWRWHLDQFRVLNLLTPTEQTCLQNSNKQHVNKYNVFEPLVQLTNQNSNKQFPK